MLCKGDSDWSGAAGGMACVLCGGIRVELPQPHAVRGPAQNTHQHTHCGSGGTQESWT